MEEEIERERERDGRDRERERHINIDKENYFFQYTILKVDVPNEIYIDKNHSCVRILKYFFIYSLHSKVWVNQNWIFPESIDSCNFFHLKLTDKPVAALNETLIILLHKKKKNPVHNFLFDTHFVSFYIVHICLKPKLGACLF